MAKLRGHYLTIVISVLLLAVLACNAGGGPDTGGPLDNVTVTVFIDPTVLTLTPVISSSETPGAPGGPAVEPSITPTNTPGCGYWSEFLQDVTIPDGTELAAGTQFEKTWQLRNNGCMTWPPGTQLFFWDGDQMGGPDALDVNPVEPGAAVDITVNLTAPAETGEYTGKWQLITPDGISIGPYVFVQINVVEPSPTPVLTATPTSKPSAEVIPFIGTWLNEDPNGRIIRIQIRESSNVIYVHVWSKESSGEVDWGEVTTPSSDAVDSILQLTWSGDERGGTANRRETQKMLMLIDGRLRVEGSVDYIDATKTDFVYDDTFDK